MKKNNYLLYTFMVIFSLTAFYVFTNFDYQKVFSSSEENKNVELQKVTLNEVVHSVFYAPQYVAYELGYFEEEGLDVEIVVGNGSDKSMTALISGEADIILAGPESSMYVASSENGKDVVNVGQLTKRAGNFLIAKDEYKDFNMEDVIGKTIIGGRPGGMPQMTLEYVLKSYGIEPFVDVNIITNLDFTATVGAFSTGEYDFTVEFEPSATKVENEGFGKVVASLGVEGGEIPYTSYITTKQFTEENSQTVEKFLTAIYKGQKYVSENTSENIAKIIEPQFEGITLEQLVKIVDRYKSQDTWNTTPICDEKSYEKLQEILVEAGTLINKINIKSIVNNSFARKIVGN